MTIDDILTEIKGLSRKECMRLAMLMLLELRSDDGPDTDVVDIVQFFARFHDEVNK